MNDEIIQEEAKQLARKLCPKWMRPEHNAQYRDFHREIAASLLRVAQAAQDSGGKEAVSDDVKVQGQKILLDEILWQPLEPGSYNPQWSGYAAGHYCIGRPDMGWCLYSRGAEGCWKQRTKTIIAPEPDLEPLRVNGKWWWARKVALGDGGKTI